MWPVSVVASLVVCAVCGDIVDENALCVCEAANSGIGSILSDRGIRMARFVDTDLELCDWGTVRTEVCLVL